MNDLIPFAFDDVAVRALMIEGEPHFVAVDVAKALGYRDAEKMARMLEEDDMGTHEVGTLGGRQSMLVVNEPGVYLAVFKSRREEAKAFRRWLATDVLPALRRTGQYSMPSHEQLPVGRWRAAHLLRIKLLDKLAIAKPGSAAQEIYDQFRQTSDMLGLGCPQLADLIVPDRFADLRAVFWAMLDHIGIERVNHSRNPHLLVIRLPEIEDYAATMGIPFPDSAELRAMLKSDDRYVRIATVSSSKLNKSVKGWVFTDQQKRPPAGDLH